jgi:hypothetical protein
LLDFFEFITRQLEECAIITSFARYSMGFLGFWLLGVLPGWVDYFFTWIGVDKAQWSFYQMLAFWRLSFLGCKAVPMCVCGFSRMLRLL